jgi:hypothetical protein
MAFFQWRDRFGPQQGIENSMVKLVFEARTKMLNEEEKRKEEMFKLASI